MAKQFPALLDHLATPILLIESAQVPATVNQAFLRLAGLPEAATGPYDLDRLFGEEGLSILKENLETARMSSGDFPCRLILKNECVLHGSVAYLRDDAEPYFLIQGQPERVERYLELNRELFRTQEALVRQRYLAKRHQKAIEGLDEFLSVLMHDIRSPLCTVWTSLQLAVEDLERKDYSGLSDMLESGESSTKRLLDFVDRLYQNVRVGQTELNYEDLDIATIVQELEDDLQSQFQASGSMLKIVGSIPVISGDRQLMRQLFQNLMQNAMKFRSPDRRLSMEVGAKLIGDRAIDLYVKDNGVGFPMADASRLFERYHKNSKTREEKEKNDGMGIGLATCKLIADKHGWTIRAEAKEGEGATFYLRIGL